MAMAAPSETPLSPRVIKRAENTELPLAALEAIVEVKEHLDHLEIEHIKSAREKGASWEDIARAMGITRQALQQRVRHREKNGGSETP